MAMSSASLKLLTRRDALSLLELIQECVSCNSETEFRLIMKKLGGMIGSENAVCGYTEIKAGATPPVQRIVNISYPEEFLEIYSKRQWSLKDPVMKGTLSKWKVQYFSDLILEYGSPKDISSLAEDCGISSGYSHGVRNLSGTQASFYGFAGRSVKRNKTTEVFLEVVAPHIYQALKRIIRGKSGAKKTLSAKELEVLKWIKKGKSSWEISIILRISERTVKFHVSNIMAKLDAASRSHAVAIAFEQDLIDIDLE